MKEHEKLILEKIRLYALQIADFKGSVKFDEFSKDAKTVSACVFNLSQIGELTSKLGADFTGVHGISLGKK